jgi:hypothetical protein
MDRHEQLRQFEEDKTPDSAPAEVVHSIFNKPSVEVEDVDFEPILQIPSYRLCFAVSSVMLGLTLLVVALVSDSDDPTLFGIPTLAIGIAFTTVGSLGTCYVLRSLHRESEEERVKMVPYKADRKET